jgi:hypothetical protein
MQFLTNVIHSLALHYVEHPLSCAHRSDVQFFSRPSVEGSGLVRYSARFGVFTYEELEFVKKKAGTRNSMMTPVQASHTGFPVPAGVVIYWPPLLTIQQSTCSSSHDLGRPYGSPQRESVGS